jgi:folate-binding protein YgfZ
MATRSSIARLESRALVAVAGADWRSFLQGLLTQDVERLASNEARFAALLTPQGRLLFDLFVIGRDDGCWLDCASDRREALLDRLTLYRLRAKVTFDADEEPIFAAWGAPPQGPGWIADPRLPTLGWRGYGLAAVANAGESDYERHRLALGAPGPADWGDDRTYPLEADFDLLNGIDFKKGCFVGQETTSRMKRRGAIKSRMLPVDFQGPAPAPGAEILAGETRAGEICSGLDGRAIGLLRLDRLDRGELRLADGRACRVERPDWMTGEG